MNSVSKLCLHSVLLLSALSSVSRAQERFTPRPEPLYAYAMNQYGVTFQVFSGGCTDKRSFRIITDDADGVRRVVLYRTVRDACLALFPYGLPVRYSYGELGMQRGQPLRIMNPFRRFVAPIEEP